MTHYDNTASQAYVQHIGMIWDESFAARVDVVAHENGITQEQYDVMVREYAWQVNNLFTPSQYSWLTRVFLALHFLIPLKKGTR